MQVYGHRGARGLAPGSTLPSYQTALDLGVDAVDMDIQMTRDGVLVVYHDFYLNSEVIRDASGSYITNKPLLKDLTYKELQQYDVGVSKPGGHLVKLFPDQKPAPGSKICSLEQIIQLVKKQNEKTKIQIEIKYYPKQPGQSFSPDKIVNELAKIIRQENIVDRVEVQAFDWSCLQMLKQINPNIKVSYLTRPDITEKIKSTDPVNAKLYTGGYLLSNYDNSIPKMILALGGNIWGPRDVEVTKELVQECHDLGLRVVTWSLVEKLGEQFVSEMIDHLIDCKVDGIITDRPDLLINYLGDL